MPPKKLRCDFFGLESSIAQATSLPSLRTLNGRFSPSATRWKPVTLPTASQFFGQAGSGVCLVLPRTLAFLAPAEDTATAPTIATHSAAKARGCRTRARGSDVDVIAPFTLA